MTLSIHVPDAQAKALAEEMEQRGYAVVLETEDVPNWHKVYNGYAPKQRLKPTFP